MMELNTGIFGSVSNCVSSVWDRIVSTVQTLIDTIKAKVVELWKGNPLVGGVMAIVAVGAAICVVMFFPAVVGLVKAVGSGIIKIATSIVTALLGAVRGIIDKIGGRINA